MSGTRRISDATIDTVEAELPGLRRFARLLTGSAKSADDLCTAALRELLFDGGEALSPGSARLGLYGACHRVWTARTPFWGGASEVPDGEPAPMRHLFKVQPGHREALLLAHVARFSDAETAEIMRVDPRLVRRIVATAEGAIHSQMRTSVLIIEDESLVACDLRDIVQDMDHEVVGIARTAGEAIEIAARERPGLILADVKLADGSTSLEGLKRIALQGEIPTIFITAYPGEAIAVGDLESDATQAPVLAKPFSTSALRHSIAHTLFHSQLAS